MRRGVESSTDGIAYAPSQNSWGRKDPVSKKLLTQKAKGVYKHADRTGMGPAIFQKPIDF